MDATKSTTKPPQEAFEAGSGAQAGSVHAVPEPQEDTVTIVFTDIEGSTAINERVGDRRWLDILRQHESIVREEIGEHGELLKSWGDGHMIVFPCPRAALHCAIAIQRRMAAYNEREGREPLHVRIGLHTGVAIAHGDDYYGRNVAMGARIADEARGGEILVSGQLRELIHERDSVCFSAERQVALKGLQGVHTVHSVDLLHPIEALQRATSAVGSLAAA